MCSQWDSVPCLEALIGAMHTICVHYWYMGGLISNKFLMQQTDLIALVLTHVIGSVAGPYNLDLRNRTSFPNNVGLC